MYQPSNLDQLSINTLRFLAADAVQKAKSGHLSLLHYGLLRLTGYDLPLEELQSFRQWGSQTPGHPDTARPPASR